MSLRCVSKRFLHGVVMYTIVAAASAFVSVSPRHHCISHRRPLSASKMDHDFSLHEMNRARQKLEELIGPIVFDDHVDDSTGLIQTPHLLTNAGRKRRKLEIQLLQSLVQGDDAIDELMSLWIHECPCKVSSTDSIKFMSSEEATCTLEEAESTLRHIIADCPIELWPEPGARLAYVLFQLGQYTECERYIQAVLQAKPWHFEMLQMQMMLQLSFHGNRSAAIVAARQGLPALTSRRRSVWVQHAVRQAKRKLRNLEEYSASAHSDASSDQTEEPINKSRSQSAAMTMDNIIPNDTAVSSIWQ
jgi:hypothetical protein